jgi:hypothetical protein
MSADASSLAHADLADDMLRLLTTREETWTLAALEDLARRVPPAATLSKSAAELALDFFAQGELEKVAIAVWKSFVELFPRSDWAAAVDDAIATFLSNAHGTPAEPLHMSASLRGYCTHYLFKPDV